MGEDAMQRLILIHRRIWQEYGGRAEIYIFTSEEWDDSPQRNRIRSMLGEREFGHVYYSRYLLPEHIRRRINEDLLSDPASPGGHELAH